MLRMATKNQKSGDFSDRILRCSIIAELAHQTSAHKVYSLWNPCRKWPVCKSYTSVKEAYVPNSQSACGSVTESPGSYMTKSHSIKTYFRAYIHR